MASADEKTSGAPSSASSEKTFRAYTSEQGTTYAQARQGYHPNLFKRIVDHHVSTGGQLGTLVDVGCGPGTATRALAPQFATAVGLDASEGMIATARKLGGASSSGQPIRYELSSAEELGSGDGDGAVVPDGTADLITAATAAHWFDMAKFWPRAGQLLRPGGTVALWTGNFMQIHPSTPNAEAISAAIAAIEERELEPFMEAGNRLGRSLYQEMPLPWTLSPALVGFDEASFVRKEWGTPGQDDAERPGQEFFISGQDGVGMGMMETALGTASPVTRWRQANPDKVGTEQDVVRMMRREVERLLHEAGVPESKEIVRGKVSGVLLMVKKTL